MINIETHFVVLEVSARVIISAATCYASECGASKQGRARQVMKFDITVYRLKKSPLDEAVDVAVKLAVVGVTVEDKLVVT